MDQSADTKWLKLTNHGEWATHTVRVARFKMNNSQEGGRIFACQPRSTKINVLHSGWAARNGWIQEACYLSYYCLQYFSRHRVKWVLYIVQFRIMGENTDTVISYNVERSFNTVCGSSWAHTLVFFTQLKVKHYINKHLCRLKHCTIFFYSFQPARLNLMGTVLDY